MTKPKPLKNKYCMAEILFGKTLVFQKEDVKAAMKFHKLRLKNQINIHWHWLKNTTKEEAYKFFEAQVNIAFRDVIE